MHSTTTLSIRTVLLVVLAAVSAAMSAAANAEDRCAAHYQAEQSRIEREAAQQLPAKGDRAAEVTWSKNLHLALALAAKNAERCTRENTPPATPAAQAKEQACVASLHRRLEALKQKYGGRTLSSRELVDYREATNQLADDRMQCQLRPRR